MEPQILLLDEVTSALDPVLTVDVMKTITELRKQGLTMILVTHPSILHLQYVTGSCS
jgi:polar amino acid transport system ATP-binding protein